MKQQHPFRYESASADHIRCYRNKHNLRFKRISIGIALILGVSVESDIIRDLHAQAFPSMVFLADLDGHNGFRIEGDLFSKTGNSVSNAGDMNGDGIDDILIGASWRSPNDMARAGTIYVIYGKNEEYPAVLEPSDLDVNSGFIINGNAALDAFGASTSGQIDFNGDGFDDILVSAPGTDPDGINGAGTSYIIFGSSNGFPLEVRISEMSENQIIKFNGAAPGDKSGGAASRAGDVNCDGIDDIIIGARYADPNGRNSGSAYIIFGNETTNSSNIDLSQLDGTDGFRIDGVSLHNQLGYDVSDLGDINNDSCDDMAVSAPTSNSSNTSTVGKTYIVFGQAESHGPSIEATLLDGKNGFSITGTTSNERSGYSVAAVGDINGDGIADIGISNREVMYGHDSYCNAYIIFGQAEAFPADTSLDVLDGSNGFKMTIKSDSCIINGADDINNDGIDDILVSSPFFSENTFFAGEVYVVYGKSNHDSNINLNELSQGDGFKIISAGYDNRTGASISSAGDLDNNGIKDLLIGADGTGDNGFYSGRSYVIFSHPDTIWVTDFED